MKDALHSLGYSKPSKSNSENLVAVNTLPWDRTEIVRLPSAINTDSDAQYGVFSGGQGVGEVKMLSNNSKASVKEIYEGTFILENGLLRVEVKGGHITSLIDLSINREIIAEGSKANQLVIFDDKPLYWQAWDVEVYHLESRQELATGETRIAENGPHRVSVVTETKISDKSWAKTTVSLAASLDGQPSYVEIGCEVEWRETMKFLKVEFPVDIKNTEASYETQFGIVRRPTHYNTRCVLFELIRNAKVC